MIEKIRNYKIVGKLGEGGMGTVYLAEDTMLERKVALKVLNPLLTKESQFTERFRHEAKVQASLIHPNIVTLYNYFREGENYCMAMENVEGVTLKHLISNIGPMPEQRAIRILNQLLEAVGFAHKKGIIHRDIKPSNILISKDDNVKILDFGIAKILQDKGLTKTGTKLGTVYYMSPEQIKAVKDIDHRTDIYSLGITFYEMLSGRVPFNIDTDSDFEILNEIVSSELKDPREFYPHISNWAVKILFDSVNKDRNKRIQNADEFRNRLLLKEEVTTTPTPDEKTVIDIPKTSPVVKPVESTKKAEVIDTQKKANSILIGIKGWLLLFTLTLTLFIPIYNILKIIFLLEGEPIIDVIIDAIEEITNEFNAFVLLLWIISKTVFSALSVWIGIKLWSKLANALILAKKFLKIQMIINGLVYFIIGIVFEEFIAIVFLIIELIYFTIWYIYLKKSQRVKATFTN
jgi:serine/threonine protein kinase